jgi:hypothetical protein
MSKPHPLELLEEKHSTAILLFLRKHNGPVITKKSIMTRSRCGTGRPWRTLRRLEEAGS